MIVRTFPLFIYFLMSSGASVVLVHVAEDAFAASWIFRRFAPLTFAYSSVKFVYIHSHLRDPSDFLSVLVLR